MATIGVPTYERAADLERCLKTLSGQTHAALRIVVADNASKDPRVRAVIEEARSHDPRIVPIYRPENIGMSRNFADLVERADTPYFMWVSDDDYLAPRAVEVLVELLEKEGTASMACGATRQFKGQRMSAPLTFSGLRSTGNRMADIERFLMTPEIGGKGGHVIYGLFRTPAAQESARAIKFGTQRFSEDVMFVFAFLCRYDMTVTDETVLFKHTRSRRVDQRPRFFASDYSFPRHLYREYRDGLVDACATEQQRALVRRVMHKRWLFKTFVSSWRKPLFRAIRRPEENAHGT
jgi:glycosyltransferase involved in cell wall biosynthesis